MPLSVALLGVAFIYGMCLTGTLLATAIVAGSGNVKNVKANLGPQNVILSILLVGSIVAAALGH